MSALAPHPVYPTPAHERAAHAIVDLFCRLPAAAAVILTGSCARGRATKDSCLDVRILASESASGDERAALEAIWQRTYQTDAVYAELRSTGRFSNVDLDITDGRFVESPRGWTSGPDAFELDIGNTVVYAVPLWERDAAFTWLAARWRPFYDDERWQRRLTTVSRFAHNNLDHVPLYVARGLHFQAFHRLYHAFQEFLQALFIARRTYPIAYNKWVREQVVEILGLPELYRELPRLFEYRDFESDELNTKAETLRRLFETYMAP